MSEAQPETPFHDLDAYIELPRGAGQTVLAFVDHHVLGKDWQTPDLLH